MKLKTQQERPGGARTHADARRRATRAHALSPAAAAALACLAASILFAPAVFARQPQRRQPAPPARGSARPASQARVPDETLLRIARAEDERRWEADDLGALLSDPSAAVRSRAALAAGRIGDARAVPLLLSLLTTDKSLDVRARAAFALGEIESALAVEPLIVAARPGQSAQVRARAVEALGKIAAALPREDQANSKKIGDAITAALNHEHGRRSAPDREAALLALAAALRARPAEAGKTVAQFLDWADARVRADAANTLARLRSKDANEKLRSLLSDRDAVVRANAARALGAAEDKGALDALIAAATKDADLRVRVSALRAVASLRESRSAGPLIEYANLLLAAYRAEKQANPSARPAGLNELLEVAAATGRVLADTNDARALELLRQLREREAYAAPEAEMAFARVAPAQYMRERPFTNLHLRAADNKLSWQSVAALAQGLGELAQLSSARSGNAAVTVQADAQLALRALLTDASTPALAIPGVLRAAAAFKPLDLPDVARAQLKAQDTLVRATAAELLASAEPDPENERALAAALPLAMREEMNDAALAILEALARQKTAAANEAIRTALESPDYLLRLRAATLLQNNQGPVSESERIQTVAVRFRPDDYRRALARVGRRVTAVVSTDKGAFTVELLPDDAPLNVDNFVELARRKFFDGIAFHRVVPNFVIQGGDPRGDGNGGPGYQIRCEINEAPYERGAVGMALSGKDTGGSQWFVTHSPQPHLDGGYTVFGRVVSGMEVVDRIVRGDRIRAVIVTEASRRK
jgi:cyclophilin family peptidyl-prolyl cis-trans isomerase/HEAT repeat protein